MVFPCLSSTDVTLYDLFDIHCPHDALYWQLYSVSGNYEVRSILKNDKNP